MNSLTVEDTFFIQGRGLIAAGKLDELKHGFRIGLRVQIIRPDGSHLYSEVRGMEVSRPCFTEQTSLGLLLDAHLTKADVPRGSVIKLYTG